MLSIEDLALWGAIILIIIYAYVKKRKTPLKLEKVAQPDSPVEIYVKETYFKKFIKNINKLAQFSLQREYLKPKSEEQNKTSEVEILEHKENKQAQGKTGSKFLSALKLVNIIKPIGFWTGKIFDEHKDLLQARMEVHDETKGFWVNYVNARKRLSRGKGGKDFRRM